MITATACLKHNMQCMRQQRGRADAVNESSNKTLAVVRKSGDDMLQFDAWFDIWSL